MRVVQRSRSIICYAFIFYLALLSEVVTETCVTAPVLGRTGDKWYKENYTSLCIEEKNDFIYL
jgi:hypothetical protein